MIAMNSRRDASRDLLDCLLIEDHVERDACIIRKMEARIDARFSEILKKVDDIPTREEFEAQAREIGTIFERKLKAVLEIRARSPEIQAMNDHVDKLSRTIIDVFQQLDSTIVKKSDLPELLKAFATKDDIARIENRLDTFATKEDLKEFATKDDLDKNFDEIKGLLAKKQ